MKSSNLAWRIETLDEPAEALPLNLEAQPVQFAAESPSAVAQRRIRPRPRFERRTIEIRDQGFAPFRIN